ncbi:AAEL003793-PA, partial [Aedes aegypti]
MTNYIKCFCTGCQQMFTEVNEYIAHLKTHRLEKPLRLVCTFQHCTQKLTNMYRFSRHLKTHLICREEPMEYDESNINDEQLAAANDTETPNTSLVSNKTVEAEKSTTIHESIRTVEQKALSFILALHKKRNFTRKDVIDIQREIKSMYSQLEQLIRACAPAASDPQAQYTFDVMLSKISSLFDFIDTEHKLFKYLRDRDLMRKPQMFIIQRNGIINVDVNDDDFAQNSKACLVLMDLEFQIRKFLESDNVLEEMKQNVNTLMGKPNLCHYINGSTYQKIYAKYPDRTIIPIFFYADEFEI